MKIKRGVMMFDNIGWTFGRILSRTSNGFLVRRDDGYLTYVDRSTRGRYWRLCAVTRIHWTPQQLWAFYKVLYR